MFRGNILKSILWDKAFESTSIIVHWLFVYLTYHFTNEREKEREREREKERKREMNLNTSSVGSLPSNNSA